MGKEFPFNIQNPDQSNTNLSPEGLARKEKRIQKYRNRVKPKIEAQLGEGFDFLISRIAYTQATYFQRKDENKIVIELYDEIVSSCQKLFDLGFDRKEVVSFSEQEFTDKEQVSRALFDLYGSKIRNDIEQVVDLPEQNNTEQEPDISANKILDLPGLDLQVPLEKTLKYYLKKIVDSLKEEDIYSSRIIALVKKVSGDSVDEVKLSVLDIINKAAIVDSLKDEYFKIILKNGLKYLKFVKELDDISKEIDSLGSYDVSINEQVELEEHIANLQLKYKFMKNKVESLYNSTLSDESKKYIESFVWEEWSDDIPWGMFIDALR